MEEQVRNNMAYHYTSVDTAFKILDGIENEHMVLHASDVFSLNDPSEMKYGYKAIMEYLPTLEKELSLEDSQLQLSKLWDKDRCFSHDGWREGHLKTMEEHFKHLWIISLSRNEDNLPMWTLYGGSGTGLALGIDTRIYLKEVEKVNGVRQMAFNVDNLSEPCSIDVEYHSISRNFLLSSSIKIMYKKYLQDIQGVSDANEIAQKQLGALSQLAIIIAPLIKHSAYEHENESRLLVPCRNISDIKFKTHKSRGLIPYVEMKIPVSYLKRIVVGPCCNYSITKRNIEVKLLQKGIDWGTVEIVPSTIPYRL